VQKCQTGRERQQKITFHAPAENRTRGPTMGMLDFTTKPLARDANL
jgi:hypothetical protein